MAKIVLLGLIIVCSFVGYSQTYEMYEGDTINLRDVTKKRQGLWIKFDSKKRIKEKGYYVNNKKEGIWKVYYPLGALKSEITYKKNRPDGFAKFYYENGKISEQGIWELNKWVGNYKYFHTNGNLAYDWNYNNSGKRTGEQKYYYDDGSLMIKGSWANGKKEGSLKEYYQDGSIKSEMNFEGGRLNISSIKEYEIAEKPSTKEKAPNLNKKSGSIGSKEKKSHAIFTQTGNYKTYNEFSKIDREGDFVNGKLIDGKRYFYDDEGNLTRTIIYKGGKVSGAIDATN